MISAGDFSFVGRKAMSTMVESPRKFSRSGGGRRGPVKACAPVHILTTDEKERLLRIIARVSLIHQHSELLELLQSEDFQYFIPHQVVITAWGDFSRPSLQVDVISAIPGMRTRLLAHCSVDTFIRELHARWVANGRRPLFMDSSMETETADSVCGCALQNILHGDWSLVLHGIVNVRDGGESLYVAINHESRLNAPGLDRFSGISDALIAQLDVGLRRTVPLRLAESSESRSRFVSSLSLTEREEEILRQAAQGKTNQAIGQTLSISAWTVKSHMQRIMRKLHAGNRLEAVTKYGQLAVQMQSAMPQQIAPLLGALRPA